MPAEEELAFTRLSDGFFSVRLVFGGDRFASGVLFSNGCDDVRWERLRASVARAVRRIEWADPAMLHREATALLPSNADPAVFADTFAVSIGFIVTAADEVEAHVAYGDDGVYAVATLNGDHVASVDLND